MTALPDKASLYGREAWFREAWEDCVAVAGKRASSLLHRHALLLFKPDAIAFHAVRPTLAILRERGFRPVAAEPVLLDRHITRWLWLYRFNVASVERIHLHDLINEAGFSLVVILRDVAPADSIPASVRLTDAKGPSRPERRRPDQVRSRLGVDDRIINYVHTSDEPADMARELGILLPAHARRSLLERLLADECLPAEELEAAMRSVQADRNARRIDLDASLGRLRQYADRRRAVPSDPARAEAWSELGDAIDEARAGTPGALRRSWDLLRDVRGDVDPWDLVVVGSRAISHDEPGADQQSLGDAPPGLWAARAAARERPDEEAACPTMPLAAR